MIEEEAVEHTDAMPRRTELAGQDAADIAGSANDEDVAILVLATHAATPYSTVNGTRHGRL